MWKLANRPTLVYIEGMKITFKTTKKKPNSKNNKGNKRSEPSFLTQLMGIVLLFIFVSAVYSLIVNKKEVVKESNLTDISQAIILGNATGVTVSGSDIKVTLSDGTILKANKEPESSLSDTLSNYGVSPDALSRTPIEIKKESGFRYFLVSSLPFLIPLIIVGFLIYMMTRQVKGSGMQAFNFGQSRARILDPNDEKNRITFDDVAGAREAKQELREIVEFLREPKKFLEIGAEIPKGVLLTGHPGTGKTLLARAVAGEAKVPFFHLSGSEFVELFVGVGASRVRDLFKMAKKMAPAIVFIDEIDAVGRSRGVGMGGGNDEREQTLNQILVEMDGFEPTDKVIVIAATNRSDVLDSALLRPGRFDRRVTLDLPDRRDRTEILKIHAKKKKIDDTADLETIAARTPGFSGADLFSVMNEAAILAARRDAKELGQIDLTSAVEKVMIGPERQSHLMGDEEKKLVAYHEAGHALLASLLPHADPVHKVSIISRGTAGGYTLKIPLNDKHLPTKNTFLDDLVVFLGGYATEEIVLGDITTGPSNDLQVATGLARDMVTKYGMSSEIGPMATTPGQKVIFGNAVDSDVSPALQARVDAEVEKLMKDAHVKAHAMLNENRHILDAIANKLMEVETLEQDEYNKIIESFGIKIKTL